MKERDGLIKYLKRFYSSPEEAEKIVRRYLEVNPNADKAQIFNDLAHEKGSGKSHHTYMDGELLPGRGRKRKHRKGRS